MVFNPAVSVVDFLSSKGLKNESSFEARQKFFESFGLNEQLGDFVGSAEQNTALLNRFQSAEQSSGVSLNAQNAQQLISASRVGGTTGSPAVPETPADDAGTTGLLSLEQVKAKAAPTAGANQVPGLFRAGQDVPSSQAPQPGQGIAGVLPQVPGGGELASQALERIQQSATFPLQLEAQEANKSAIQLQAQRDKEGFIRDIASRGLFFSGAKTKGLQTIEADALSEVLGVDRKFALLIAQGLETAAQQIAKEAQAGRKEAIDALKSLGFAINPLTNRIEPTLAARKQVGETERAEARIGLDVAAEERLQRGQELGTQEFIIEQERKRAQEERIRQQAEEDNIISRARLTLDIAKEQRIAATAGEPTPAELRKVSEDTANMLTFFASQPDRKTALEVLDVQAGAIVERLGPEGLEKALNEIERRFPPPQELLPLPIQDITPEQAAGRKVGGALKAGAKKAVSPFFRPLEPAVSGAITGFVSGIFK